MAIAPIKRTEERAANTSNGGFMLLAWLVLLVATLSGSGAGGVVVAEANDRELRQAAVPFEAPELLEPHVNAARVGDAQVVRGVVGVHAPLEAGDHRLRLALARLVLVLLAAPGELALARRDRRACTIAHRVRESTHPAARPVRPFRRPPNPVRVGDDVDRQR